MSDVLYNSRQWLNPPESHYTGSIVCFDGLNVVNQGKTLDRYSFVEISSCHGKVRIHKDANLTDEQFKQKIHTMITELIDFVEHLEN